MKMSNAAWLMLIVLSFLWGTSYFLIEIALEELPVLTLVALRIAFAAVVLWTFVLLSGNRVPKDARTWLAYLVMGLLNNVIPFSLIVWGQTEISSSLASILNATTPIFAVVVAAAFLSDGQLTPAKTAVLVLGFIGVVVMIGPDAFRDLGQSIWAQLAIVLAGFSYASASVFGRRFHAQGIAPTVSAACQVSMSSLLLVPFVFTTGGFEGLAAVSSPVWASVFSLAVFSTAVAYMLYFRILATAGATNLMLVTFLIPVTAILLGTLLLHESLQLAEIAGMLLIALALLALDGRLFSRRRTPI
ncbi:MAG TPA: DMT family transporter [Woeseiaceae bacterium]|nr:DMT family transporter [Woeseiaceae bacterium]